MKYKEIIEYRKRIKENKDDLKMEEILKEMQGKDIIELLKFSEVDLRKKQNRDQYENMIEPKDKQSQEEFKKYEISNEIYHNINEILQTESFFVQEIARKDSLGGIILMIHLHFIFSEYCKQNSENNANIRELIINYFNQAIPYFIHGKGNINLVNRAKRVNLNTQLLNNLYKRLESFSAYEKVMELLEMYRYNFVDFEKEDKLVKLKFNKEYSVLSRVIACQDFFCKHNVNNLTLTDDFDKENNHSYKDEDVYRQKMKNFFWTDDLSIRMGNTFSIDEWIKIFIIVVKENLQYWIKNRYSLLIRTQKEWIQIFQENGFEKEKAKKILMELTFSQEDKDIREKPFIQYKKLYITVPSFIATIDIYEVLIHVFHSKRYPLNFKGSFFEQETREAFKRIGIHNSGCKVKQVECDMAFIFDDCLFICELKNELQLIAPLEWYRFYKKMDEHIEQIEKIYQFFAQNLQYLTPKLNKPANWKPKKIYKMILYSGYLGETRIKDNLIISNVRNVTNFFEKTQLFVHVKRENNIYMLKACNYEKYPYFRKKETELTVEDFMNYIKLPLSIWFQKEQFIEDKQYIGILDQYLIEIKGYLFKEKIENLSLNFEVN